MALFEIQSEPLDGIKVIKSTTFPDSRGSFTVTFLQNEFTSLGLPTFVRQMRTRSKDGVIRGLHFQSAPAMGKLIEVVAGSVLLISVDVRPESPTFLQHHAINVDAEDGILVWASAGFARGYFTRGEAVVQYSTDAYVGDEMAVRWNDPRINIDWPTGSPILSEKDRFAPTAEELWGIK